VRDYVPRSRDESAIVRLVRAVGEGWARKDGTNETVFSDKYNRIALTTGPLRRTGT
jgi:hypothetical protein